MSGRLDAAGALGGDGAAEAAMRGSRSDAVLCRRVREQRDEQAFRELVGRYRRAFYAVVNGFRSAEDLVERDDQEQEALIAFWQTAQAYDHTWKAPYGAIACGQARDRLTGAVRHALRHKERANRDAARLDAQLTDKTTTTLADVVAAPAAFWEPDAIAQIRHELRVLSTELPRALSPTEREAMERLMLGERAREACGSAVTACA
jgi:DNA-directed RNA polymerase specialized sigma24 family protein